MASSSFGDKNKNFNGSEFLQVKLHLCFRRVHGIWPGFSEFGKVARLDDLNDKITCLQLETFSIKLFSRVTSVCSSNQCLRTADDIIILVNLSLSHEAYFSYNYISA